MQKQCDRSRKRTSSDVRPSLNGGSSTAQAAGRGTGLREVSNHRRKFGAINSVLASVSLVACVRAWLCVPSIKNLVTSMEHDYITLHKNMNVYVNARGVEPYPVLKR